MEPEEEKAAGNLMPVDMEEPSPAEQAREGGSKKPVVMAILAALVLASGIFGWKTIVFYRHHEETDDAYVTGHIDPVLPRIAGYVTAVNVRDNQFVRKGDLLVTIDTRDLQSKREMALAGLETAQAKVAIARANVEAAKTNRDKTQDDEARYAKLLARQEVPRQQYDAARAAAVAARAQYLASQKEVGAAQAEVAQKQAEVDYDNLQISYAAVTAPAAGTVSKKSVEVGELVQAGQPLMAIVEDQDVWVLANYKETQLRRMRVGQTAEIEVDAYPSVKFHGKVDSFAAATGAQFALLPPDNATGNFTKVVQRIPVKIILTDPPDPQHPLRAGMSVTTIVNLG